MHLDAQSPRLIVTGTFDPLPCQGRLIGSRPARVNVSKGRPTKNTANIALLVEHYMKVGLYRIFPLHNYNIKRRLTMPEVEDAILDISCALQTELRVVDTSTEGRSHIIHQLADPTGTKYTLRIPSSESAALLDKQGHEILRYLSNMRPYLPIPEVVLEAKSFTLHKYLEGEPIRSWNPEKMITTRRHTLLDGIAEFLVSLWTPAGAIQSLFSSAASRWKPLFLLPGTRDWPLGTGI